MSSQSHQTYAQRGKLHPHAVARRLFKVAMLKSSNLVVSADVDNSKGLLELADKLGPYMAVLKTHVDIVSDFTDSTWKGLRSLAQKHDFLIFEDRKLVDIGNTAQKQYHGGAMHISEWADIVNVSVLGGDGIVEALDQTVHATDFPFLDQRALIIFADMTSEGSLATGAYTEKSVRLARKHARSVIGFVATHALNDILPEEKADGEGEKEAYEDFVVFTTSVNMASHGDKLGQTYKTPAEAVGLGADFIIAGRGIYQSDDPVATARAYRDAGWNAYLNRTSG